MQRKQQQQQHRSKISINRYKDPIQLIQFMEENDPI